MARWAADLGEVLLVETEGERMGSWYGAWARCPGSEHQFLTEITVLTDRALLLDVLIVVSVRKKRAVMHPTERVLQVL